MHNHHLDLNLLQVFLTIYREGSLTRAARRLHLTQPAVSHALARLRDQLGDPLFEREGNAMVPTAKARQLFGPVSDTLHALDQALVLQPGFDPSSARQEFRLGLRDVLEAIALPPLMQQLQKEAPGIGIASVRTERRELESALASGSLDLAVDVLLPLGKDIRHQLVSSERLVVLARRGHPALNGPLTLDRYLEQRHILVSSRRRGQGVEDFELTRLGLQRDIALRCQHFYAACQVAAGSDLLLTMPEHYARLLHRDTGTSIHPLPMEMPPLDVYLYWHARQQDDPASLWLRQHIVSVFRQRSVHPL